MLKHKVMSALKNYQNKQRIKDKRNILQHWDHLDFWMFDFWMFNCDYVEEYLNTPKAYRESENKNIQQANQKTIDSESIL